MSSIDPSFLTPFIGSAIKTFRDMCGIEPTLDAQGTRAEVPQTPVAIAGAIGITGRTFQGAMTLAFPEAVFLDLMGRMLGETRTEITPDLEDGAAEISNIIFGQAKVALNEAGHRIQMAMPGVVRGQDLQSRSPLSENAVVIRLGTPAGPVFIEFSGKTRPEDKPESDQAASVGAPALDAQVLMSFVEGVRTTLKTQCNLEAKPLAPFFKNGDTRYSFDIGGMVGITGASFSGTFAMTFEKQTFLSLLAGMLGETFTEISPELEDAAAELVNIVFGMAKQVLNAKGYALQMAIPTLLRGKDVQSLYPSRKSPIVLPFKTAGGSCWVEFAFDVKSK